MSAPTVSTHINAANTLTSLGALLGLAAVAMSLHGHAPAALTCLIGAILCDRLDGIVARRLGQSSAFGVQTFRGVPTTIVGSGFVLLWAALRLSPVAEHTPWVLAGFLTVMAPLMLSSVPIRKGGWLIKALQILALPTLIATWLI